MASAIQVRCSDGSCLNALVKSGGPGPLPGVLILHEIFGLTDFIHSQLAFFSDHQFLAMAPDLYHRVAPDAVFGYSGASWSHAFSARSSLDDDESVQDVGACVEALRLMPGCNGDIALVGYCLGGLYAFLGAAVLNVNAAVGVHGVRIETRLDQTKFIKVPLQLHFCGRDKHVPLDALARITASIKENSMIEKCYYPQAEHGFARLGQPVYRPQDAAKAQECLLDFLNSKVGNR